MLSISGIGSSGGAANYYGKDDYYVTGEADSPGLTWGGKGSDQAGLKGISNPAQFRAVLNGSLPAFGEKPGRPDDRHRPGWDLTFSAPKSVSLLALVGGDQRLAEAHRGSVKEAMAYAERYFAITRIRETNGSIREARTGNFVYASTEHQTSRKGDPQLHTHNIVANKTWDEASGVWRALETFNLYKHYKTVGLVYQAALAKKVLELGYSVSKGRDGTFEIADVTKAQLATFSKRNADIKAGITKAEAEKGRALTGAERDHIVLKDRPRKLDRERAALLEGWKTEAKSVGLDLPQMVVDARSREYGLDKTPLVYGASSDRFSRFVAAFRSLTGIRPTPDGPYAGATAGPARQALSFAVRVLEQGKAVFTQHEMLAQALRFAPAGVATGQVLAAKGALEQEGHLLAADRTILDAATTRSALLIERRLISEIQAGHNQVAPLLTADAAQARLSALQKDPSATITLNEGQLASAMKILTSSDRYVGLQGSAGVGKTTMFRVVNQAMKGRGELHGVTAQHQAAKVLRDETGINAQTIESWLRGIERAAEQGPVALNNVRGAWSKRTLLIDESSMTSNAQIERIMKAINVSGVRQAILMGDFRQLGSPEAGAPFRHALNGTLDKAEMDEIRRQKDPELLAAVKHLAKGEATAGVRGLAGFITQIGSDVGAQDYAKAAHKAWKTRYERGEDAKIIVPTNELRGLVSDEIRQTLITDGKLGHASNVAALRPDRMSRVEKHSAARLQEGHVLVFHRGHTASGLDRNEAVTVVGRDVRNNLLLVETSSGRRAHLDLSAMEKSRHSYFEAYLPKPLEVREGEKLVWDRHDAQKDQAGNVAREFKVGAGFTVEKIEGDRWTIRTEEGDRHVLNSDDQALRFISFGYAQTADRAQGSTYHQDVIAVLGTGHGEGATVSRLYVMASRAAQGFELITNDVKKLTMRLNKQSGLNPVGHEELREFAKAIDLASGMSDPIKDLAHAKSDSPPISKPTPEKDQEKVLEPAITAPDHSL